MAIYIARTLPSDLLAINPGTAPGWYEALVDLHAIGLPITEDDTSPTREPWLVVQGAAQNFPQEVLRYLIETSDRTVIYAVKKGFQFEIFDPNQNKLVRLSLNGGTTIDWRLPNGTFENRILYDFDECGGQGYVVRDSSGTRIPIERDMILFHELGHVYAFSNITGVESDVRFADCVAKEDQREYSDCVATVVENALRDVRGLTSRAFDHFADCAGGKDESPGKDENPGCAPGPWWSYTENFADPFARPNPQNPRAPENQMGPDPPPQLDPRVKPGRWSIRRWS
jgi:hypothetical protein